jgi:hypothetical protein
MTTEMAIIGRDYSRLPEAGNLARSVAWRMGGSGRVTAATRSLPRHLIGPDIVSGQPGPIFTLLNVVMFVPNPLEGGRGRRVGKEKAHDRASGKRAMGLEPTTFSLGS